ncbi:MAG: ATP-sensitive inward rectifier potassium channel 10 [Bdellovibrionaceae bacterium]|nr:ATP-sensitive inward rectifier potassium channel 10 [Pseudobdellovibrionaceae bacterium]|tara:strand:- start:840 stop:1703 length:864 start_codon:yes stop_codon:yes gene_type:complete
MNRRKHEINEIRVKRRNLPKGANRDFYHRLLVMPWGQLIFYFGMTYLVLNLIFALLYYPQLDGVAHTQPGSFRHAFFFSVQTLSTIGYGAMYPESLWANFIASIESFVGLISAAMFTGLAFAKFSRPTAKVLFSKNALITEHDGKKVLLFRIANIRMNQIIDASVSLLLLKREVTKEGIQMVRLVPLELSRSRSPVFSMSWLVTHELDESSPLQNWDQEEFKKNKGELIATLHGTDGTLSQTVHSQYYYRAEDLHWGGQFKDIIFIEEDDSRILDLKDFHKIKKEYS